LVWNLQVALYEKEKVAFYIIVEPNSEVFDVYALKDKNYRHLCKGTRADSYQFDLSNGCKASIDFAEVFV